MVLLRRAARSDRSEVSRTLARAPACFEPTRHRHADRLPVLKPREVSPKRLARVARPRFSEALRRRRRASDLEESVEGLTYLETIAVKAPTRRLYSRLWAEFINAAAERDWLPLATHRIDDHLAAEILDEWFFEGLALDDGSKLIAATKHMVPAFRRQGPVRLPRAERALTAWRKASPERQRAPLPRLAAAAMVAYAATVLAEPKIAAKWLLAFDTYLRPGEIDRLKVEQIVPPCDMSAEGTYGLWSVLIHPLRDLCPGKTGLFDEAVLIDDVSLAPLLK